VRAVAVGALLFASMMALAQPTIIPYADKATKVVFLKQKIAFGKWQITDTQQVSAFRVGLGDFTHTDDLALKDRANWAITFTLPDNPALRTIHPTGLYRPNTLDEYFYLQFKLPSAAKLKEVSFTYYKKVSDAVPLEPVKYVLVADSEFRGNRLPMTDDEVRKYNREVDRASAVVLNEDSLVAADPLTIDIPDVASKAQLLGGNTADVYRAKVKVDLATLLNMKFNLDLRTTLSSRSDDKQSKFDFVLGQKVYPDTANYGYWDKTLAFSGNQAFTNNGVCGQIQYIMYRGPIFPGARSYDDFPADYTKIAVGAAYTSMFRVDSRISSDNKKDALYGFWTLDAPSSFFDRGHGQLKLSASVFGFTESARKQFPGLHTLDGYVDATLLIPVVWSKQAPDGTWSGGTWFKVGWQAGVVRENAFTRSAGLVYSLSSQFRF
jgi:hypothetical protein